MDIAISIVLLAVFALIGLTLFAIMPMVVIAAYRDLIKGKNE